MNSGTASLAASITKAASQQTYHTIRFMVDRGHAADAYRAYAYFRWVDDVLDGNTLSVPERGEFLARQMSLVEDCYRGGRLPDLRREEQMLADLVRSDPRPGSGLASYIRNMMAVMSFDARRRGCLITQDELSTYSRLLATAVTEAMHHFIGRNCPAPCDETRYLAVTAAHITHMLRDTLDDVRNGYYNIPREVLELHGLRPSDTDHSAYRAWVKSRVDLARALFERGRQYLSHVQNPRCRLAGFAYATRFEGVLDDIERDGCRLRPYYRETGSLAAILAAGWSAFRPDLKAVPAPNQMKLGTSLERKS